MTVRELDLRDTGDASPSAAARGALLAPPDSFLQTPFWAGFKASHGWVARHFVVDETRFLTVLVRPLARFMAIAYVPLPFDGTSNEGTSNVGETRGAFLARLAVALKPFLPASTAFVRFDPPWHTVEANDHAGADSSADVGEVGDVARSPARGASSPVPYPVPPGKPALRAASNTQPPDTVVLDLTLGEDALLARMKPKWRYNVKLAEKKGVSIRCFDGIDGISGGIAAFYALYLETAKRDGIAIHSKDYYESLVRRVSEYRATAFDKPISVRVYVAEHGGAALASIITLFCGDEAVYLYGASSNENRNLMPAYALQWRAIRDATRFGCVRYDFYGIPPTDDPSHPMSGLYRFKTGFGGAIVHRVGSWDIALRPVAYRAYRIAESLRDFWFKKAVKRLRGIRRSS